MCRLNSTPFFLSEAGDADGMQLGVGAASGAEYKEQLASVGGEDADDGESIEGACIRYWDVASVIEWERQNGDCAEEECVGEGGFKDIVLQPAGDFNRQFLGNLHANEDAMESTLPSAATRAGRFVDFGIFDVVARKHFHGLLHQGGIRCLSPCDIFEESQGTNQDGRKGMRDTASRTTLSRVSAGGICLGSNGSSCKSTVKRAAGAILQSGTEPPCSRQRDSLAFITALHEKGDVATTNEGSNFLNANLKGDSAGKRRAASAVDLKRDLAEKRRAVSAVEVSSVALQRRSCSLRAPPLDRSSEQLPSGGSGAARKQSFSSLKCPKPQQQADIACTTQSLHAHSRTCPILEKASNSKNCTTEVSPRVAHRDTLTNKLCITQGVVKKQTSCTQKCSGREDQPAAFEASRGARKNRPHRSSSSYRGRLTPLSVSGSNTRNGGLRCWDGKIRAFSGKNCGCSSKYSSFERPERRGMALAFLFMLLSLSAEVLLLRLAAANTPAQDKIGRDRRVDARDLDESSEGLQRSEASPPIRVDKVDEDASVKAGMQAPAVAAAKLNVRTAKALWRASNAVYVAFLVCSLLRFLLFMTPGFAAVACARLMTCVSVAFLSRGLWAWCSALEASSWQLRQGDGKIAGGSQQPYPKVILYTVLDACGIWAFAPELAVGSLYQSPRHSSVAPGILYSQSLIMSILVCFWGIYTNKRWIVTYMLVPAVATVVWVLRISATYISAEAAAEAAAAAAAASTINDAGAFEVLLYFPASDATPCIFISCFVLLYHLVIEAAVQKRLQSATRSSQLNFTFFSLRALLDRCPFCGLLEDILVSIENLHARIDDTLYCPPIAGIICRNRAPLAATEKKTRGQGSLSRPRCDPPEPGGVCSTSQHGFESVALSPPPLPCVLAIRRVPSTVRPFSLSTTPSSAGSSCVGSEVSWEKSPWNGSTGDTVPLHHDRQYARHYGSPNRICHIDHSASGGSCCIGSGKTCTGVTDICSNRSNSACTTSNGSRNIPIWRLREAKAPSYVFHSTTADVSPSRHHRRREGQIPISETPSGAVREDWVAGEMYLENPDILQRITLIYAGSGDFDLHLILSLVKRCMRMFHRKDICVEEENC